ncbi:glycoside hydrolase family 125 protein [[Candida] arabinofermentans NRRL YB-2248]|uniref:Glycoside hydrolase family 125 protein n=1 Tax=[Candida] arabinofermentans NRRL YB-2248 TaxID=983967 RepID=A0A1E4SUV9_9ASCO|nr:glycoside hydrolase family 125 protein [[Candida] arabinofermentans NRRL YB-2248]
MVVPTGRIIRIAKSAKLTFGLLVVLLVVLLRGSRSGTPQLDEELDSPQLASSSDKLAKALADQSRLNVHVKKFAIDNDDDNDDDDEIDIPPLISTKWFKGMKKSALECPDYVEYSKTRHLPFSEGSLKLPFMRPEANCRTFVSSVVEKIILDMNERLADPDLARLFENAFPNTLDTTILWFDPEDSDTQTPRTFISTGDIHAEWLRDSARQLSVYQPFTKHDKDLQTMIKGAIIQQAIYITKAPYCNAFQPPEKSGIVKRPSSIDFVSPRPPWLYAFECKWELDSLASFLTLTNEYYENTLDSTIFTNGIWQKAFDTIMIVLRRQSSPTFDEDGNLLPFYYTFQRDTRSGTETLPLSGSGNPVNGGTGLIRSSFRPSDDACIYQLFIPANAQLSTELKTLSKTLLHLKDEERGEIAGSYADKIRKGIQDHAIVNHPTYGKVYAYEIDGYGGLNMMDDANLPSLLSLPDMGFISQDDEIYQNTRKMILSVPGNPYYLKGSHFEGIGGPHVGLRNAWPMSLLLRIRTSDNDDEILSALKSVLTSTGGLGLLHETVDVTTGGGRYTRQWFSWCNSEFGKTILDLAARKPELIFKKGHQEPYVFNG